VPNSTFTSDGQLAKLSIRNITDVTLKASIGAAKKVGVDRERRDRRRQAWRSQKASRALKGSHLVLKYSGRNGHYAPSTGSNA